MVEERAAASPLLAPYVALDLTSARSRLAGSFLAHLGMRVLRPCRDLAAELDEPAAWFENSGKELWIAEDPAAVRALVPSMDVVLADDRSAESWRAGAAELAARNADAIVTSITPFGPTGPCV